jgi:hypothetical protein
MKAENRALAKQARKPVNPVNIVDVLTALAKFPSPWPSGKPPGAGG